MEQSPADYSDRIYTLRGRRIMLDADLAMIYGVETRSLNQAVRRNILRFPNDFMFILTKDEIRRISQIVISSGGQPRMKFSKSVTAFTEHGAVMLAAVLNSGQAVHASVAIARAFVQLKRLTFGRRELAARLKELELRVGTNDRDIKDLFTALESLIEGPSTSSKRIGFQTKEPSP